MVIQYRPAFEHPIGIALSLFLGVCTAFALLITLMNAGRYGYTPSLDFYWPAVVLLIHANLRIEIMKQSGKWRYSIYCLNKQVRCHFFDSVYTKQQGRLLTLVGKKDGKKIKTLLSCDMEYFQTYLKNNLV